MAEQSPLPIAIVGMACRLPGGSDNPDKLWNMLSEGRSGWREIPADRWNKDSFYHPDPEAKEAINTKSLYFLDQDIAAFDARFFNIHPHEAHCLDPQQRILLETTYEALENAGQTLEGIKGSDTSVYVGAYATDFERMGYKDISRTPKAHMIGTGIAILSNRISYVFDLKGASSTVDTGCSGSMVALHQACHGLRARESKMAIVAGTQLVLTPDQIIPMSSVGMTNPDGKCYVFDSRGAGYARGEGVVSFVLKRLDDAVRDGDTIHAIIRNAGVNQDGKTAGLTLPNSLAQANLMRFVYQRAGLDPLDTTYVEAHGTGTQAGDNAEISSIAEVFCAESGRKDDLYVGSIKSNIGHLEASSGVAGLLKAILILKHGMIPPNIDFIKPKPTLHLEERKIKIATGMVPLPSTGPRRVSVNSFGYGGTNAHVILEHPSTYTSQENSPASKRATNGVTDKPRTNGVTEKPKTNGVHTNGVHDQTSELPISNSQPKAKVTNGTDSSTLNGINGHSKTTTEPLQKKASHDHGANGVNGDHVVQKTTDATMGDSYSPELFVLSARSENSLQAMVSNLQSWVSAHNKPTDFHDLAYTLATRRSKMPLRFSTVAANPDELISLLGQKPRSTKSSANFRSIFLFTGQGAQWHAMGKELTASQPLFRESMLKSDKILRDLGADWSLIDELSKEEKSSRVGQAEISQPSTTAIQLALVDLLQSYNVLPEIVLGHSSGEIAAAYAAGALDHETALEISYRRGFMSQACARVISTKGAMMAVGLGEHDVKQYLDKTRTGLVSLACVNSPVSTTISGDESAIDELKQIFDDESIFNRKLKVDTAYHSHHMKKVASEYLRSVGHIKTGTPNPKIKFYSSVVVAQKTADFGAQYWVDNLVSPVRFGNALELICRTELATKESDGPAALNLFTEIGPHGALAGPVRQTIKGLELADFKSNYLSTLERGRNAVVSLLDTAGKLFELGYPVSLQATLGEQGPKKAANMIDDLTPYPWDHSTSYLYESSLSKQHRFRAHPPHDLLGLRVAGTTTHEPTWRNFLGVDSLPWLRDHVVDGFAIYPAAAYLCMAIEAVRQISIDRRIQGVMSQIHLRNVSFMKSIIIPERRSDGLTSDVEVLLTLRPAKHLTDRTWESFRIMALSPEDVWHEHCTGAIMVEWASKDDEVEGVREKDMTTSGRLQQLQEIKDACDTEYGGEELYKNFADNGNVYGPAFSGIQSVRIGPHAGISEVSIPDVASMMPRKYQQPHLIHPGSFDAVFQLGIPLYRRNIGNGPVMPTVLEEVTVNCNLASEPGTKWVTTTTMTETGFRFAVVDIMVFEETADGQPLMPVINIRGGALRGIGEAPQDETTLPFHRKMSYGLKWQPDIDFISHQKAKELTKSANLEVGTTNSEPTGDQVTLYEKAAAVYIRACLEKSGSLNEENVKPHLRKLLAWMKTYESKNGRDAINSLSEQDIVLCLEKSREAGIEGQMLSRIGENLPAILAGDSDSLSIMSEDDLLERFYATGLLATNYLQTVKYLELLAFKQPHMKILEIGAGIGSLTTRVFEVLDRPEGLMLGRYCYTDTHADTLEKGKALLQKRSDHIDFKTLNISKDPTQQGFQEGAYDLIIASNVLSKMNSLDGSVANARKLLKPTGRLIIIELTRSTAALNTILGTLPEWWAFDDGRKGTPLLSEKEWDATLKRQGFNGADIATPDRDGPTARSHLIVSKAADSETILQKDFPSVDIICQSQSDKFLDLAQTISTQLNGQGFSCSSKDWASISVDVDSIYIVLDDVVDPVLAAPSDERFTQIVSLVTQAKNVLWLSCQESSTDLHVPGRGLVNGLARVVRRENAGIRFVTVNVQESVSTPGSLVPRLSDLIARSFATPISAPKSDEDEYTFSKDQLLISRVHADAKFDDWVKRTINTQNVEVGPYQQPERPLKLEVETPGLLSSLRFVDDEVPLKLLGPFDLELEAKAYGINFKDVFIAMGQMVPGVSMTGECAGIVRKVGSALTDKYRVGDRVCGLGAEPFSSYPRVDGNLSHKLPASLSYAVGASIPIIFCTAYHCIVEVARLQHGQTILIHAASGGVGQAAIQLAQNIGAEIFCTVGSSAKRQLLIDHFKIPPSHIFSSRLRTFKQGILRLTENKGVDCVLNSLSGESLHDSFAVLASLGTFVEIGKSDIYKKNEISMIPFDKNVTFAGVDLTVLAKLRRPEMHERLGKLLSMFDNGTLQAVKPITTYPMTDIEDAFRLIQSRKHTGKVVLICDEETQVKVTLARPRPLSLAQDGSYVIAGGLGDLGRRIAKFLASHGAGHVVTLSRRKLDEQDHSAFQEELRILGAELHVITCDVTDKDSVQSAAAECSANLPPVRGVVHAGMVLRDHPFENMSLDDYMTGIRPKVQGTQNLDDAFGASGTLDFFIMLSSISAILGKSGQSNYAVGNAFQDAFAQSKPTSKCRYIALNLGAVDGSLAITSLPAAQQEMMRQGSVLMSFEEVFKVMEYSMSPQANKDDLHQLILGFDRKSMEAVHDEFALANPMLSQIPYLEAKEESKQQATTDIGKLLQEAKTPEEIHTIVVGGICTRFAMFTAASPEEISPDVSMESFGLDSLVAIELKNWLVRTFQAALQTSEVLDAPTIASLAKTIASRSKLIARDTEAIEKDPSTTEKALAPIESAAPGANHSFDCCRATKVLRKMPLVEFDTMLNDYLQNSRMFFPSEKFETIERDVAEFRKPGSNGRKFYDRLYDQAHDPNIENWQDRYFLQSMYLQRRMPLAPFNNFMAFHPLGDKGHTQAQRAALIASITFKCKQDLEADKWEPMAYLGTSNCTDLWQYIFNAARLPGVPLDRMAKFPGNDYLAVLHRGHIFKVMLKDGDENVSIKALTKIFQSILDREDTSESWTSMLSCDDRTSWAENREALIRHDEINKETIDMVEAAAFLVCLDDTAPQHAEERIRDMMMLEGFNRWVDKTIAFVVCQNATSGTYVEHTMIDVSRIPIIQSPNGLEPPTFEREEYANLSKAMTLFKMQTSIVAGIHSYEPRREVNGHANGHIEPPKEFLINTTPPLEDRVLEIRKRFKQEITSFGYRDIILSDFGKDFLLEHHLPIKGLYDLLCLLANYYYYGYNAQSWEAISMSHYHKGRPDIVQVNTPVTARFCTIADDETIPARERFEVMLNAANNRNQTIKDAFSGHCYQRTLRALELCAEEGEELPDLFKNPNYEQTVEPDQMFSNTDGLSPESCFIMQNPQKFWMTYYVTDAGSHFSVITGKKEVIKWADSLVRASAVMKTILDVA
ncbi:hypothetical protein MMC25_003337 [Agyrium rufum]|nr:hypothetical protein [Agyrium rufum]